MKVEKIRGDAKIFVEECQKIGIASAQTDRMPTRDWRRVFVACRQERHPKDVLLVSAVAAGRSRRYIRLHKEIKEAIEDGATTREILTLIETIESYRSLYGANLS